MLVFYYIILFLNFNCLIFNGSKRVIYIGKKLSKEPENYFYGYFINWYGAVYVFFIFWRVSENKNTREKL